MRRHILIFLIVLAALALLSGGASAEDTDIYLENEWNFVDGSMDASNGIPENATEGLKRIREAGVVRVATEPYFAPQEFIDPSQSGQDRFVGADMNLARLIARRMGVELKIVPMEFSKVLESVAEGKCDLAISGLSYTPGRASMVELSKGYYFNTSGTYAVLVIRESDADAIAGIEDLDGRNIIAQSGSLQEALTADNILNYHEFRRVATMSEAFAAVSVGLSDAAIASSENAETYIQQNPDCHLIMLPLEEFDLVEQFRGDRIAAKKGEIQMMYFINGIIDEVLESGEYEQWMETYEALAASLGI